MVDETALFAVDLVIWGATESATRFLVVDGVNECKDMSVLQSVLFIYRRV